MTSTSYSIQRHQQALEPSRGHAASGVAPKVAEGILVLVAEWLRDSTRWPIPALEQWKRSRMIRQLDPCAEWWELKNCEAILGYVGRLLRRIQVSQDAAQAGHGLQLGGQSPQEARVRPNQRKGSDLGLPESVWRSCIYSFLEPEDLFSLVDVGRFQSDLITSELHGWTSSTTAGFLRYLGLQSEEYRVKKFVTQFFREKASLLEVVSDEVSREELAVRAWASTHLQDLSRSNVFARQIWDLVGSTFSSSWNSPTILLDRQNAPHRQEASLQQQAIRFWRERTCRLSVEDRVIVVAQECRALLEGLCLHEPSAFVQALQLPDCGWQFQYLMPDGLFERLQREAEVLNELATKLESSSTSEQQIEALERARNALGKLGYSPVEDKICRQIERLQKRSPRGAFVFLENLKQREELVSRAGQEILLAALRGGLHEGSGGPGGWWLDDKPLEDWIPNHWWENPHFAEELVACEPQLEPYLAAQERSNPTLQRMAVLKDSRLLMSGAGYNRETVITALRQARQQMQAWKATREADWMGDSDSGLLDFVSPDLQADPEVVLAAVESDWEQLQHAREPAAHDPRVLEAAVRACSTALQWCRPQLTISDRDLALRLIEAGGDVAPVLNGVLWQDDDLLRRQLQVRPESFVHFHDHQYSEHGLVTREVLERALEQNGGLLGQMRRQDRDDKALALRAVAQKAEAFLILSDRLKADPEVFLKALDRCRTDGRDYEEILAAVPQACLSDRQWQEQVLDAFPLLLLSLGREGGPDWMFRAASRSLVERWEEQPPSVLGVRRAFSKRLFAQKFVEGVLYATEDELVESMFR